MGGGGLHLLLIEDNPADAGLIEAMLGDADIRLDWVQTLDDGVKRLTQSSYDAVLLDLSLPDSQGIESVATTHLFDTETPIIVLTGLDDEANAFEALRAGAQDYLVKDKIDGALLLRTVRFARERVRVQRTLAEAEPHASAAGEAIVRAVGCPPGAGMLEPLSAHLQEQLAAGPVVYVTFDRPGTVLLPRFESHNVDVARLHIIDTSGADVDDGRIFVPDDPRDLDAVSVEVELACAALGPGSRVIVDAINPLIMRHGVDAAAMFCHGLANRLRVLGISGDFLGHRNQEWPFIMDRFSFFDDELHLDMESVSEMGPDPSIA